MESSDEVVVTELGQFHRLSIGTEAHELESSLLKVNTLASRLPPS